ncbi:MAG: M28 family peptidase [Candidatus Latescibacteria bacterium]|jgi:aminoglycoside N3'-acetyltransferase|nr:M28 family peptidase [Candidatus Latescibacterota bacterium]
MIPLSVKTFCKNTLPQVHAAVIGTRMIDDVRDIVETDRWNSFDRFHDTTKNLVNKYHAAGVKAEVYSAQTGGSTDSGRWVIQEASDVNGATVDIVAPVKEPLLNFADNPWHVIQWSAGTATQGLTCDIVVVDTNEELDAISSAALTGKIILTAMSPRGLLRKVDRTGAAGIITDQGQAHLPDATPWVKFGWGQIPRSENATRLLGLAISRNRGKRLRSLIATHGTLAVHVTVDIRKYVGSHDVVSGIVEGKDDPQDEIWVLAHSAEPGAVDNASGVSVCLEMARVLQDLIAEGKIPRPRRSIRFLNAYECYGFFHYMEHVKRLQTPLAGVCLDTLGIRPELCDGNLSWRSTIPMSAGFVDRIGEQMLRATLELGNPGYTLHSGAFIATSDTLAGDPQHGFPCPWLTTHYLDEGVYHAYHSSADTVDLLSADGLAVCASAIAGYLLYLANMGSEEIVQIAATETEKTASVLSGGLKVPGSGLAPSTRHVQGLDQEPVSGDQTLLAGDASYLREAHATSMKRLKRWMWGGDRRAVLTYLDESSKRIEAALAPYGVVEPTTEAGADSIPYRTAFLSPSLANVPEPVAKTIAAADLADWALFWANGQRSIGEISELLSCEYQEHVEVGRVIRYFGGLEALGYVRILSHDEWISKDMLIRDLNRLGLVPGMDVMVHSSLARIGYVEGGPDTVVDALLEAVGPEGTVLAPSFNHRTAEVYNPMTTPTISGSIPDALWRRTEAERSMQATHAVAAVGQRAAMYCCQDHYVQGIWSPESPIGRLVHGEGYLLSLGVAHDRTTAYHVAETSMRCGCIDPFGNTDRVVIQGEVQQVRGLAFRSEECPVDPMMLHEPLRSRGLEAFGKVGNADSTLVKGKDLWDMRREQLGDSCRTCSIKPLLR